MFRAAMGPSSGDTTVFIQHLVLVFLYRWLSGMQGGTFRSALHTWIDKHKYTKKKIVHMLVYLQDHLLVHKQESNFKTL